MHPRTKRQREVLDYITRFVDRNGYHPSYQQIARQLGVSSKGGIQRHIVALENQGLLARKRDNGSFAIEFPLQKVVSDSVCGIELIKVSDIDGRYIVAERSAITIPRFLMGDAAPDEMFAFCSPDDSMIEQHVRDGDIVLFVKRNYARRGEIALFQTDDGQMIIGLYCNLGSRTEIRRANQDYEPAVFPADEVAVQGVMRGLLRYEAE